MFRDLLEGDIKPGAVVFLRYFPSNGKSFGVVIDEGFWIEQVKKENPWFLEKYEKNKIDKFGMVNLFPVRILGTVVDNVFFEGDDSPEPNNKKILHYTFGSIDGSDLVPDIGAAMHTFSNLEASSYLEEVSWDLGILSEYLSGEYDFLYDDHDPTPLSFRIYRRKLIRLFEKSIPR